MGLTVSKQSVQNECRGDLLINEQDPDRLISSPSHSGICAPVVGYEILRTRKKHVVYKIHVLTESDNWYLFKTYKEFFALNKKLHQKFPSFCLKLPKRRWLCSQHSYEYLQRMRRNLQIYLDVLMQHNDLSNSELIEDFLQLSNPPGPMDSFEQSKAHYEDMKYRVTALNDKVVKLERELEMSKLKLRQALQRQKMLETLHDEQRERKNEQIDGSQNVTSGRVVYTEIL